MVNVSGETMTVSMMAGIQTAVRLNTKIEIKMELIHLAATF